ncbi:MAG: phosphatidyl-myo-inositol dimannoside synthase [Verrucomicrobiota bacterium]
MKVFVIFHRFGPYHVARLEAAAQRCEIVGVELGSETAEYGWAKISGGHSFKRVALFPEGDSRGQPVRELEKRMRDVLAQERPDVVAIPGWSERGALVALHCSVEYSVPVILMSETAANDEARTWRKEAVKRRIVRRCSSALVGGMRHRDYLVALGMAPERIFTGYDAVDNDYFAEGSADVRSRRSELRQKHGLPQNYFLASARFIPKKNLDTLIRAYAEYRTQAVDLRLPASDLWSLVILGDGPLKSDLCHLVSGLGIADFIVMPGFKQYDELPIYYGLANAFVHASRVEQWGLVVNEAMASGLPVIVSDRCGCAPELVKVSANGFLFDPTNQQELASHLLMTSNLSTEDRAVMGRISQEIVAQFDSEVFGEGMSKAAEWALAHGAKSLSLFDRLLLWAAMRLPR